MLRALANGETFVPATMCPHLPVPFQTQNAYEAPVIRATRGSCFMQKDHILKIIAPGSFANFY